MPSVHPAPERPVLLREKSASKSRLNPTFVEADRGVIATIKWWRWWKPIFIIMVSAVTVADQLVASWLVLNYMLSGHWGWFSIAAGTFALTMTISGLFAAIEDRIPDTAWIPKFLKDRPFLIGFFLLYVPFATVKACQAALVQHEALHGSSVSAAKSRFGRCSNRLLPGQLPCADPLFSDVHNRLSYRHNNTEMSQEQESMMLTPQGSLTGPPAQELPNHDSIGLNACIDSAVCPAAGSQDSPVATLSPGAARSGSDSWPAAAQTPGPTEAEDKAVSPITMAAPRVGESTQGAGKQGPTIPADMLAEMRLRWRNASIQEVRQSSTSLQEYQQIIVTVEWMRLVQSLFQDIFTLALQVYIVVLVRQQDVLRFVSIGLGCSSLAINVALMFGDYQPLLRKFVVSFHVAGQISWRLVVFSFFSVSQAEKAIPVLLVLTGTALVFSIFLHRKSGWVIAVVFTFPLWFLAWDTQSAHKSDLFGWKRSSSTDMRTVFLRLGVLWRALENVVCAALVLYLSPVNPCTAATSDMRYLNDYCMACCRGPIYHAEFQNAVYVTAATYVISWIAGWALDNFYFQSVE